ncbi:hypothetical protein BASA60_006026 [Batrachochytrium salamandrivorans]|nr:hypothetical protein BASA60_006026 [Batrachochytrium salamandrivorans]
MGVSYTGLVEVGRATEALNHDDNYMVRRLALTTCECVPPMSALRSSVNAPVSSVRPNRSGAIATMMTVVTLLAWSDAFYGLDWLSWRGQVAEGIQV